MKAYERAYKTCEVAEILGITRQSVNRQIEAGHIPCVKITERIWRVPGAWVHAVQSGTLDTSIHTPVETHRDVTKRTLQKPTPGGKGAKK